MNNNASYLDQALAALNLKVDVEPWREAWAASQAEFDPGKLFFLNPEFVTDTCRTLNISTEIRDALLRALAIFEQRPALRRLAWHGHYLLSQASAANLRFPDWPRIPMDQGESAILFYVFIALSGVPNLLKMHRERGIPESITVDTLSDIEVWIREHRQRYGMLGLEEIGWLCHHLTGKLFKLGRLQFACDSWGHDFHAFRHHQTRKVILLSGANQPYRADGQFADADGATGATPNWISVFDTSRPGVIRGYPVTPDGRALSGAIELARSDWEEIFRKGDPALAVHIPATGPMSHEECGESFRQACRFFPAHFPDRPWRAFTCSSWLLDPQFERHLPESANIVRFLKEMYLHPVSQANSIQTFQRVFGKSFENLPPERIDEAPQTSSLQRIIVQHVKAGGRWRMGGSMLFPEDLDWGAQAYRNRLRPDLPGGSTPPK